MNQSNTEPTYPPTTFALLMPYLAAVGKHLPTHRKNDILAELGANLLDAMEDREEELRHSLTLEEQAAMLRAHGHPFEVAMRYQPQRALIGPLFGIYWYTLKRATPLVILFAFASQLMLAFVSPESGSLMYRLGSVPYVLFLFWAVTTAVFAGLDYGVTHFVGARRFTAQWDPMKLLQEQQRPTLYGIAPKYPIVDLIADAAALSWLVAVPHFPVLLFFGPAARLFHIEAAPIWHRMLAPIAALLLTRLVLKAIAIGSRHSARRTGLLYVAADLCSALALALLVLPGEVLFTTTAGIPIETEMGIQFGILMALKVALVAVSLTAGWKLWQTMRLNGPADGVRGTAACL
ncbi:hypothetical protein [Terriglobus albidus]|uniref:hypothetical protein n=1 Tax=Terriglobus albidus TaxID=1592106 RepID=UPI0021DF7DFF|nr:hypothetical protein [Terriglobus albidus]